MSEKLKYLELVVCRKQSPTDACTPERVEAAKESDKPTEMETKKLIPRAVPHIVGSVEEDLRVSR